jgi:hypothetical protein
MVRPFANMLKINIDMKMFHPTYTCFIFKFEMHNIHLQLLQIYDE